MTFFSSLLSNGGYSSKRFWGGVILLTLCGCYIYCTITSQPMLATTDAFLMTAGVLLGINTVMSPFRGGQTSNGTKNSTSDAGCRENNANE